MMILLVLTYVVDAWRNMLLCCKISKCLWCTWIEVLPTKGKSKLTLTRSKGWVNSRSLWNNLMLLQKFGNATYLVTGWWYWSYIVLSCTIEMRMCMLLFILFLSMLQDHMMTIMVLLAHGGGSCLWFWS